MAGVARMTTASTHDYIGAAQWPANSLLDMADRLGRVSDCAMVAITAVAAVGLDALEPVGGPLTSVPMDLQRGGRAEVSVPWGVAQIVTVWGEAIVSVLGHPFGLESTDDRALALAATMRITHPNHPEGGRKLLPANTGLAVFVLARAVETFEGALERQGLGWGDVARIHTLTQ